MEQQPMTEAMYYILLALLEPGHGYGMMQRIREISHGRMEMGPGTLYGVLNRMKKEGWITLEEQDARICPPPRAFTMPSPTRVKRRWTQNSKD